MKFLFVCLGNICRSPVAEAVVREYFKRSLTPQQFAKCVFDSAGTAAYHVGEKADPRMRAAGRKRGYTVDSIARQFTQSDLDQFDMVLAMDRSNLRAMQKLAESQQEMSKIKLFGSFSKQSPNADTFDPYYSGEGAFDEVIDFVEEVAVNIVAAWEEGVISS